ncbi:LysR substrate-binding domain-containing protein [Paracoccus hibiscisoli]|uniref:LysR substrate-binding domain-containing protein n=1 Tax=Paracoccus hibiscisoli TaxID=2023261 RepID=UPI0023F38E91|nr:LysR substrate-binding domain-containing protein [Paracoccus hibiscisoli]
MNAAALGEKLTWAAIATEDRLVAPRLQRRMAARAGSTVVDIENGYMLATTSPDEVAEVIAHAAEGGDVPPSFADCDSGLHAFLKIRQTVAEAASSMTAKAESLRAPLKSLLAGVTDLVDPSELPLAEIRQSLRISMADYPALFVTCPLQRALAETAPGIDLVIQPWHGAGAAKPALMDGSTDIAISVFPDDDPDIQRDEPLSEHYVIALRPGHPATPGFDLDRWLAWPHILVSGRGEAHSPLDAELARLGRSRRVGLVVPSFGMVPDLLRGSDMIAMLPHRVMAGAGDLIALPTPIPVAGFPLHLAWHRRRSKDRALRHVVAILTEALTPVGRYGRPFADLLAPTAGQRIPPPS